MNNAMRSAATLGLMLATISMVSAVGTPPAASAATPAAVASGLYEQDNDAIQRIGTWETISRSTDSGGSSANAKVTGDSASLTFVGDGVAWVGRTGPALGQADVFIDGRRTQTVDLYAAEQQFQRTIFEQTGLSDGEHTIRIVRLGTHSNASKGNDISLDAFRITDTTAPPPPKDVVLTADESGATVQWSASSTVDVVGYRVYRALGQNPLELVSGTPLLTTTTFKDIGLTYGATYRFAVAAVDSSGNTSVKSRIPSVVQPAPVEPRTRASDCPSDARLVSSLADLRSAVASAVPGSAIRLAPGRYAGGITVTRSGTASNPIWICGPRTAVLDNGNVQSKNGVLLDDVRYVNVAGFAITNFRKGVVVSSSDHVSVADLYIRYIGEEAIKVRYDSTNTVVLANSIISTGNVEPGYGEGVYIGTSPKQWCAVFECNPDQSNSTLVIGNDISGTRADPIEAKPGTRGGVIRGNKIDGRALTAVTTLMAVKGNDYLVTDNVAVNGPGEDGFFAGQTEIVGYGRNNLLARNSISVASGATAIRIGSGDGNIIDCSNVAKTKGSILSNVTCQR